ncbi:hypothetical protein RHGRI_003411 [Rhododendron griersonianum]|uniref:FBD domain-containing protein n=1 Tax=Rhododendron griersonianum TaxID=479676 RepID=A0AAV6L835_9ERIC|nr:hypothetical protein RHGRI_003411 [Rhododendron griersonianum]KAG5560112.1 hypothetical protein RHGRI_003411 [Rhododendron griersonianum]
MGMKEDGANKGDDDDDRRERRRNDWHGSDEPELYQVYKARVHDSIDRETRYDRHGGSDEPELNQVYKGEMLRGGKGLFCVAPRNQVGSFWFLFARSRAKATSFWFFKRTGSRAKAMSFGSSRGILILILIPNKTRLLLGFIAFAIELLSMGKKVRLASLQVGKKDDRNSDFEAAVTSVVSRRWRHLSTFVTHQDFNAAEMIVKFGRNKNHAFCERERQKYVHCENQVFIFLIDATVEEWWVWFDLANRYKGDIDKWLKFALPRRVQGLLLDLSMNGHHMRLFVKSCTIPYEMLGLIEGTTLNNLSSRSGELVHVKVVGPSLAAKHLEIGHFHNKSSLLSMGKEVRLASLQKKCEGTSLNSSSSDFHIPPLYSSFGFKSLKELCLKCVNVSGEILECFLSSCPLLEILCVHGSGELVNFKVVGPSLALKCLEICDCDNIESIGVNNVNLVALRYDGPTKSFSLQNVPLLVEFSIWGSISWFMNDFLPQHSCCLSQLEIITLDISFLEEENSLTSLTPELTNVKKLVLVSSAVSDDGLLGCTSLLKAFPALQKLVWQMRWINPDIAEREIMKAVKCPCPHLEEVELAGYYGRITDLELVRYFVENAVSLKKIVIHPHDRYSPEIPKEIDDIGKENAARVRAKQQLEGEVPVGIELVIL